MINFNEKIANLKNLPVCDKELLLEFMAHGYDFAERNIDKLSIFSKKYKKVCVDGYESLIVDQNELYYMRTGTLNLGLFYDDEGKILPHSRYYLSHLNAFLDNIDCVLFNLQRSIDSNNVVENLYKPILYCERWFPTYGHFHDECFNLADFIEKTSTQEFTVLLDYPDDNELDSIKFKHNPNYEFLDGILFNGRSINAHHCKDVVLKLNNLHLLINGFKYPCFHRFSPVISGLLKSKNSSSVNKILLTRSDSYRDIGNKSFVESFFRKNGFSIVNPELMSMPLLINIIGNSDFVVLYWGSGMTNLAYANYGTNVIVVKSDSYASESIDLWNKMINSYGLNLSVVESVDNYIDTHSLFLTMKKYSAFDL